MLVTLLIGVVGAYIGMSMIESKDEVIDTRR